MCVCVCNFSLLFLHTHPFPYLATGLFLATPLECGWGKKEGEKKKGNKDWRSDQ